MMLCRAPVLACWSAPSSQFLAALNKRFTFGCFMRTLSITSSKFLAFIAKICAADSIPLQSRVNNRNEPRIKDVKYLLTTGWFESSSNPIQSNPIQSNPMRKLHNKKFTFISKFSFKNWSGKKLNVNVGRREHE